MNKKLTIDHSLLVPIGLGVVSLTGLCILLLFVYLEEPKAANPGEKKQAETPFKFSFIATETVTPDPENENSFLNEPTETENSSSEAPSITLTSTPQNGESNSATSPSNAAALTRTPTPNIKSSVPPVTTLDETTILAGKYDDTDARLDYTGDWVSELFVSGAFKETLYISPEIGDSMTFTFFGKQLILGYKSDTGFGTLTIKIDNSEYSLNQLTGSEWVSVQLSQGVHSVTVLHKDGDFVSIDYINIIE